MALPDANAPAAEIEEEVVAEEAAEVVKKPKGKAKGKGKGKAKAKGKGKAKGKAKAKAAAAAEEGAAEGDAAPKAKAKAKAASLKSRIQAEMAERDIDEIVAEAKAEVKNCELAVKQAESDTSSEAKIGAAKKAMEDASSAVEAAVHKETLALEKLKAAKLAKSAVATNTEQAQADIAECEKTLTILELELASREKVKDLEETKKAAAAAAEAAKKALEESKQREKEAEEALKASVAQQKEEETKALKEHAEAHKIDAEGKKEKKAAEKAAQKEIQSELSAIDKARLQRDQERQKKWREACGIKGRGVKALTMGAVESPKRPASSVAEGTPGKVARTVADID